MGAEPSFVPQALACGRRRLLNISAQRLRLCLLALALMGLFMTVNLHGNLRCILLHRAQIPATFILDRLLHMAGTLSVVIEFVGGALLLYLLIKRRRCDRN